MSDAAIVRNWNDMRVTAIGALPSGKMCQSAAGRASVQSGLVSASAGQLVAQYGANQFSITKNASYNWLDGCNLYWNIANASASPFRLLPADYWIGTAIGDESNSATSGVVNLNVPQQNKLAIGSSRNSPCDPFTTAFVGGATLNYRGALQLVLAATNEAEKVDALSDGGFLITDLPIIEMEVNVKADISSTHTIFSLGVATGTNATAFLNATDCIGIQLISTADLIYACQNNAVGSVDVAATSTTISYAAGTAFTVWIDCRNPAACAIYVNGVQVLSSTTFNMSGITATLYLLAHLVKTASTDTATIDVNYARVRTGSQN